MAYIIEDYRRRDLRHALKQADPAIFEDSLHFLEDHPRIMASGYAREIIWRFVKRYDLSAESIERLEKVALGYLERPMSREFRFMCQTMARIATQEFWDKVEAKLNSDNPRIQVNAYCLFAYSRGIYAGEKQRLALKGYKWRLRPREFYYLPDDDFLALVLEAENWPNGIVVRREVNNSDLPIVYYNPRNDMEFASLDMSACRTEIMFPKLTQILTLGRMGSLTTTNRLYTIYLLQQMNQSSVVPILIDFLRNKVDYKYEGVTKHILQGAALKVLKYYSTPEALNVIEQHREAYRAIYGSTAWLDSQLSVNR